MWQSITGFEGYSVSDSGDVRNDKTGNFLQPVKNKVGYYKVHLRKDGKDYQRDVHRLVAEAFIPNPLNLPQVNHKDENPANNAVSNLEWVSAHSNMKHGTRGQRAVANGSGIKRKVYQFDEDGEIVGIWCSQSLAAKVMDVNQTDISRCIHGKFNTAGGYTWSYVSPFNNTQNAKHI